MCTHAIFPYTAHADLEHIVEIRSELGSITDALGELHNDIEHDEEGIGNFKQLQLSIEVPLFVNPRYGSATRVQLSPYIVHSAKNWRTPGIRGNIRTSGWTEKTCH